VLQKHTGAPITAALVDVSNTSMELCWFAATAGFCSLGARVCAQQLLQVTYHCRQSCSCDNVPETLHSCFAQILATRQQKSAAAASFAIVLQQSSRLPIRRHQSSLSTLQAALATDRPSGCHLPCHRQ
jgi:hypothetical protein